MKYIKEHDKWNQLKIILDSLPMYIPCRDGEIWSVSFGTNVGIEIDGKGENFERPALIVRRINSEHIWVVPITQSGTTKSGIHVSILNLGLGINSRVIVTQLRTISSKRLVFRIGMLSFKQFKDVIDEIKNILPSL